MLRQTTKQLMDSSVIFRLLFWGTITLFSVAMILSIVFPMTSCKSYTSYNYRSCYEWDSYYPYQCYSGSYTYCCSYSYSYCGDSYCRTKPSDSTYWNYRPCMGVIIAAWVLYGVSFFGTVGVFFMFFQLRQRARNGGYVNLNIAPVYAGYRNDYGIANPNPYYNQNNIIVYSDARPNY